MREISGVNLLAVEEDDKLEEAYERQQGAKQSSCPDNGLTVNQRQHIGGNHKLLPTHPLNQLIFGQVVHHEPDTHTDRNNTVTHLDPPNMI